MKIKREDYNPTRPVTVDLRGPEGSVYRIWALMKQLTRTKSPEEIREAEADLKTAKLKARGAARLAGKLYSAPDPADNVYVDISRNGVRQDYHEVVETLEKYFGDQVLIITDDGGPTE